MYFILTAAMLIQFLLALSSLVHRTVTYDEPTHLSHALAISSGIEERSKWTNSIMPFSVLNTLVSSPYEKLYLRIYKGRIVTIFFLLIISLIIFQWSKDLYGIKPALFSTILFCLDPNFLAHGQLVMTDIYAAFALISSSYFYWKFHQKGGGYYRWASAVSLGVAQLAKQSSIVLYPIFLIIPLFIYIPQIIAAVKVNNFGRVKFLIKSFLKNAAFFACVSLLIIHLGFLGNKTLLPLKDYNFSSQSFKSFVLNHPLLSRLQLPLPVSYVTGFDLIKYVDETGETCHDFYHLSQLHIKGKDTLGYKGYFFEVMLFKVPIPVLILILLSVLIYFLNLRRYEFFRNEIYLLLPVLYFLIYYNYFINMNVGIRHILLIFPLIYVFCGSLFSSWDRFSKVLKAIIGALILYLLISVLSYFPHFISYANEFIWDRKMAYRYIADSNLTLGGDSWYLQQYLSRNKAIRAPSGPVKGRCVVAINDLVGLTTKRYQWLLPFTPIEKVGSGFLVFNISESDYQKIKGKK